MADWRMLERVLEFRHISRSSNSFLPKEKTKVSSAALSDKQILCRPRLTLLKCNYLKHAPSVLTFEILVAECSLLGHLETSNDRLETVTCASVQTSDTYREAQLHFFRSSYLNIRV
jgi:hypothetical protein